MKKLLFAAIVLLSLTSCSSNDESDNELTKTTVRRKVYDLNRSQLCIRNVDTLYHVGDTIQIIGLPTHAPFAEELHSAIVR